MMWKRRIHRLLVGRRSLAVGAIVAVGLVAAAGLAYSAIPDGSNVLTACMLAPGDCSPSRNVVSKICTTF